jgi:hypothetical protein
VAIDEANGDTLDAHLQVGEHLGDEFGRERILVERLARQGGGTCQRGSGGVGVA